MADLFCAVTAGLSISEAGIRRSVVEAGYLTGLRVAGLLPLAVSPLEDPSTSRRLFDRSAALLLTGGADVDPARYGEPMNGARDILPERDELEFALLELAFERGIPVLAICRGLQVLNVFLGGTLHQDLASDFDAAISHDSWREVDASIHGVEPHDPGLLRDVFNGGPTSQNSAHHQGVERLAEGLTAVGRAPDGLVEAVEYRSVEGWTVGVQWHPERKIDRDDGVNRRLFEAFGAAVRGGSPPGAGGSGRGASR